MPKGPNGEKRPADVNACAVRVMRIATGEIAEEMPRMPGRRKSGIAGSAARAAKLTPDQRSAVAHDAAEARWKRAQR